MEAANLALNYSMAYLKEMEEYFDDSSEVILIFTCKENALHITQIILVTKKFKIT